MSSAPTAPTPAPTKAPTPVATNTAILNDLKWIATHAILLLILGGLTLGGVYTVESLAAKKDAALADKYQQVLTAQTQQTQTLQQQLAIFEAQETQRDAAYQKTIAQLTQSIAQRDANEQKQQQTDQSLDAQDAANRLSQQTSATPGEVAVSGNNIIMDLPLARNVVSDLDRLNSVTGDLADTQSQLKAQQALTADAQQDDAQQKTLVAAQQKQLADAQTACNAEVKAAKAQGRKSGIKGFFIGVGTALLVVLGHSI